MNAGEGQVSMVVRPVAGGIRHSCINRCITHFQMFTKSDLLGPVRHVPAVVAFEPTELSGLLFKRHFCATLCISKQNIYYYVVLFRPQAAMRNPLLDDP